MMNTCFRCGVHRVDKIIEPEGPVAICPECGHRHSFVRLPLLIVSGASGTGKSTICRILLGRLSHAVVLDSDILWRPEFNSPESRYRDFFEPWLRMCKNISQSGRPVVLFGGGVGVPENIEPCVERRYFASVEYLALVCDDQALADRVKRRPKGLGSHSPASIEERQRFNQWFKAYGSRQPPIRLLDTTRVSEQTSARQVQLWIDERLQQAGATMQGAEVVVDERRDRYTELVCSSIVS